MRFLPTQRSLALLASFSVVAGIACGGSSSETPGTTTGDSSTTLDTAVSLDTATSSPDTHTTTDGGGGGDTSVTDSGGSSDTGGATDTGGAPTDTGSVKPETGGGFCGGIAGKLCDKGSYCNYGLGNCLKPDAGGTCEPIPDACTKELNPVCGCDGIEYGNPCLAAKAGMSIAKMGKCGASSGSCGGKLGGVCAKTEYCDYPDGAMCGATDVPGTCAPRPEGCIEIFDPVCGCDGKTYGNSCTAAAAGTDYAYKGACK